MFDVRGAARELDALVTQSNVRCISRVLCDSAGKPQRSLFAYPSLQVVAACEPGISLYDRPISFEQRNE